MERPLKVTLQILFLIALIWFLGAASGFLPGVRVQVGRASGRRYRRYRRHNLNRVVSGMHGEWAPSASASFRPVGQSQLTF
jgi:hypothetical protein